METHLKLQECLSLIQLNIKATKERHNSFGKYNYRSAEDITNAVKKSIKELKLPNVFLLLSDEIAFIGNRYYVKATASLCNCTESIIVTAFARESEEKKGMDSAQVTGSTSSYARKYALNGLLALDDSEDIDSMDNSKKDIPKPMVKKDAPLPQKPKQDNDAIKNEIRAKIKALLLAKKCEKSYQKIVIDYISGDISEEKLNDSLKKVHEYRNDATELTAATESFTKKMSEQGAVK
jgi:hypothetical protein